MFSRSFAEIISQVYFIYCLMESNRIYIHFWTKPSLIIFPHNIKYPALLLGKQSGQSPSHSFSHDTQSTSWTRSRHLYLMLCYKRNQNWFMCGKCATQINLVGIALPYCSHVRRGKGWMHSVTSSTEFAHKQLIQLAYSATQWSNHNSSTNHWTDFSWARTLLSFRAAVQTKWTLFASFNHLNQIDNDKIKPPL